MPTAAERTGDFSASGVTLIDPFTQRPFPGNVLPASRIDPVGARLMALYPAPNHADAAANLVSSPEGRRNGIQATIKTDHHGWRDRPIQVRYTFSREDRDLPFPTRSRNLPGFGVAVLDEGHQFSASIPRTSGRGSTRRGSASTRSIATTRRRAPASTSSRRSASRRRRTIRPSTRAI